MKLRVVDFSQSSRERDCALTLLWPVRCCQSFWLGWTCHFDVCCSAPPPRLSWGQIGLGDRVQKWVAWLSHQSPVSTTVQHLLSLQLHNLTARKQWLQKSDLITRFLALARPAEVGFWALPPSSLHPSPGRFSWLCLQLPPSQSCWVWEVVLHPDLGPVSLYPSWRIMSRFRTTSAMSGNYSMKKVLALLPIL